jgi:hypothetical protein
MVVGYMVKTKMTAFDMMTKPYYRDIIKLTRVFEFKIKNEDGLQQVHYRYALQESPDMPDYLKKKMKRFFGKKLEQMYENGEISKGCISKGTHLSFYLKNLVENEILFKEKGKDNKYRYTIKNPLFVETSIKKIVGLMNSIPKPTILPMIQQYDDFKNIDLKKRLVCDAHFLGIPSKVFMPNNKKDERKLEEEIQKLYNAVLEFINYLKSVSTPNLSYQDNLEKQSFSHHFGIFFEGLIIKEKWFESRSATVKKVKNKGV